MMKLDFPRYRWRKYAPQGEAFHFARAVKANRSTPLHSHADFAEICWAEEGSGWHCINGARRKLEPGDICFVRTNDVHALEASATQTLTIVNVAFPLKTLEFLHTRYFARETRWFWSAEPQPAPQRLKPSEFLRVRQAAAELALAPREAFYLERFLLNVFFAVSGGPLQAYPENLPDWLYQACEALQHPENLRKGVRHLFHLAGRSPEHVARTMRLHLDTTPSDYLNRARLNHAALQLQMTNIPVTQIAFDCGYENLSHFFHLFRRRFGRSPAAYRSTQRQDIV